jgi:phage repressor protein C with HTH and peptisase S24 domain
MMVLALLPNALKSFLAPQMLRFSSENPAYSIYQRRIDEVHIIGRVVWFARRL